MLGERCPWCGEQLIENASGTSGGRYVYKCNKCGNDMINLPFNHINICAFACMFIYPNKVFIWCMLGVCFILSFKTPVYRYRGKYYRLIFGEKVQYGDRTPVTIRWKKVQGNRQILFPRVRIWNAYVLPLYKVEPTSNNQKTFVGNVRLCRIKRRFFNTTAEIEWIGEVQERAIDGGNKYFIMEDNKFILEIIKRIE